MQAANAEIAKMSIMAQKLAVGLFRIAHIGFCLLIAGVLMDPVFAWVVDVRNLPTSSILLGRRNLCRRETFGGRSILTKVPIRSVTRLWYQPEQRRSGGGDNTNNEGDNDNSSFVTTKLDPEKLPSIHQLLAQRDPTWYEEFVIGPLGQEYVDSNYLSVEIEPQQVISGKQLATPVSTTEDGSSPPLEANDVSGGGSPTVASVEELTETSFLEAASSQSESTAEELAPEEETLEMSSTINEASEDIPEQLSESLSATAVQDESTVSKSSASSLLEPSSKAPAEDRDSNTLSKVDEQLASDSSATPTESKRKVDSTSSLDTGVDQAEATIPTAEMDKDQVTETTVKPSANQPMEDTVEKKSGVQADVDDDARVVVFGVDRQTIPLSNLTKQLGYGEEEILSLQAEVLSVIINDKIERPRLGLPAQWKVAGSGFGTSSQQPRQEVRIVNSNDDVFPPRRQQNEGEKERASRGPSSVNVDELRAKPLTTGRPTGQEGRRRTAPVRRTSERDMDAASDSFVSPDSPAAMRPELDPGERRPRPSTESAPSRGPKGGKKPRRMPPSDATPQAQSSRPSRRESKAPRKIYNVRGNLPDGDVMQQRRPAKRATSSSATSTRRKIDDPPPPRVFWPDMGKFRDLMRKESELRLRILGDDWTPSVKQETEWRMGLYKDWLWTLHNGVGNDAIVPPSRYERARRLGDRIAEEENSRQRKVGGKKQNGRPRRRDEYRGDEDLPRQKRSPPPKQRNRPRPPPSPPKPSRDGPPPPQSRGRR